MNYFPGATAFTQIRDGFANENVMWNLSDCKRREIDFQKLKQDVHSQLVGSLELVSELTDEQIKAELVPIVNEFLKRSEVNVSSDLLQRLYDELPSEMFGIGPLEPLMNDPTINDILVNHQYEVFIERNGQLKSTNVVFADEAHLMRIIQRIASKVGRRIDEISPMVDARLADGSRINAVIPPLALDGPKLSIRRFGREFLTLDALVANDTLSSEMAEFLNQAVGARVSMLISGGTGAGKTTLLNAVSAAISPHERIVTIEDSAELLLNHPHVARMETRPEHSEGGGQITQRDLLRNSLRMRPDRIVIGEVRGGEALDMLQAMNTGHDGSLTTIHANDTRDAIARLEMMVAMAGFELPLMAVRSYIASGIEVVVQVTRHANGQRRVSRISEMDYGTQNGLVLRDLFVESETQGRVVRTDAVAACQKKLDDFAKAKSNLAANGEGVGLQNKSIEDGSEEGIRQ